MKMHCEICNKGPTDGVMVMRVGSRHGSDVWRCQTHLIMKRPGQPKPVDKRAVITSWK